LIKEHPTHGKLTMPDIMLKEIRDAIDLTKQPIQFSWDCGYTLFDTVIVPKMDTIEFKDTRIVPSNRFLFVLVNFKTAWHFNVDDPPDPSYVSEKLGLGDYDSKSVSLFLEMLLDIKKQ